jgi:hypothetical protein
MTQRLCTNNLPRLDIFLLLRNGALVHGAISRWIWPLPAFPITVTSRCEDHRLFLRINDAEENAHEIIRRTGTTGNSYPFLGCTCGQSSRYLYIHESRIACRSCHRLDHPSHLPGQIHLAGIYQRPMCG